MDSKTRDNEHSAATDGSTGVRVGGSIVAAAFVVWLDRECWLAPMHGDPGRTLRIENATRFISRRDAEGSLTEACKYRPFPRADVIEVSVADFRQ